MKEEVTKSEVSEYEIALERLEKSPLKKFIKEENKDYATKTSNI